MDRTINEPISVNKPLVLSRSSTQHYLWRLLLCLILFGLLLIFLDRVGVLSLSYGIVGLCFLLDPTLLRQLRLDRNNFWFLTGSNGIAVGSQDVSEFRIAPLGPFGRLGVVWEYIDARPHERVYQKAAKNLKTNEDGLVARNYGKKPQELADLLNSYRQRALEETPNY